MVEKFAGNGRITGAAGTATLAGGAVFAGTALIESLRTTGKGLHVDSVVVAATAIAAGIAGLIGWHKADAAIKQHDTLASEHAMMKGAIEEAVHQGLVTKKQSLELVPTG